MAPTRPAPSPDTCVEAQYDPSDTRTNADVDGIAVAVANLITSVCLRILITWSDDIDEGIQGSLIQTHSILLSALISVNRDQLSLFDARFALLITSSPLTTYLVVSTYCELCGMGTELYKRIKYRNLIAVLEALTPLLWLVLSMLLRLSSTAFIDSTMCEDSTFGYWVLDTIQSIVVALQLGSFFPLFVPLFSICLILIMWRRWSQVASEVRSTVKGNSKPWVWFRVSWAFVKHMWHAINQNHKWYLYSIFAYLDASWALYVIYGAYMGSAYNYAYMLSFGQVLSLSAAIPPLASTIRFVYSSRSKLRSFARRFPSLALAEAGYLIFGREPVENNNIPITHPNTPPPGTPQEYPLDSHLEQSLNPVDSAANPLETNSTEVFEDPGTRP